MRSKRKKAESSPGRNDTFHARRRVDGNSLILPTQKIDQQIPSSVMALNSYKWDYNDIYITSVIGIIIPFITVKGHHCLVF